MTIPSESHTNHAERYIYAYLSAVMIPPVFAGSYGFFLVYQWDHHIQPSIERTALFLLAMTLVGVMVILLTGRVYIRNFLPREILIDRNGVTGRQLKASGQTMEYRIPWSNITKLKGSSTFGPYMKGITETDSKYWLFCLTPANVRRIRVAWEEWKKRQGSQPPSEASLSSSGG